MKKTARYRPQVSEPLPDLSSEILKAIASRLKSQADVCRFRSVCKKWRFAFPKRPKRQELLSPTLPRQITNAAVLPFNSQGYETLELVATAVFLVKPLAPQQPTSRPWILRVQERQPGKLHPLEPLSRCPLLPGIPESFPKFLDLSEYMVSQVGSCYALRFSLDSLVGSIDCKRVVFCCDDQNCSETSTVIVLDNEGLCVGLSLRNNKWDYVRRKFSDIIWFKGKVYAVSFDRVKIMLHIIDHNTLEVTEALVDAYFRYPHNSCVDLVGSPEDLLLAINNHSASYINLYRLNTIKGKREMVNTLADRTLFLGTDCNFLVPTRDVLGKGGGFVVATNTRVGATTPKVYDYPDAPNSGHLLVIGDDPLLFSQVLGLPPTWFWPYSFHLIRDSEDEEVYQDTYEQQPPTGHQEEPPSSTLHHGDQGKTLEIPHSNLPVCSGSEEQIKAGPSDVTHIGNVHTGASEPKSTVEMVIEMVSDSLTQEFEGVHIRSDQVPTLHEVLEKCRNDVRSDRIMWRTLKWLVPNVEKAVALNESQPLIDYHAELGKKITQAEEKKVKLAGKLASLDKLQSEWEAERDAVLKKISMVETRNSGF